MADTKTTALSANTTPADADLLPMVDDPAGTPASQKMTLATLKTFVQASLGNRGSSASAPIPNTGTSLSGVTATAHASTHTKGDWVELIASTAFAAETVQIIIFETIATNAGNTSMLLDIGTGAAASETVLIPNVIVGHSMGTTGLGQAINQQTFIFQGLAVPSGTRISARVQGATTLDTCKVGVALRQSGGPLSAGTTVTTFGADTATSNGTVPATISTNNTKLTTYTTITASTSVDIRSFVVSVGSAGSGIFTAADGLIDIAIGAASSETIIVPDIPYGGNGNEQFVYKGCELPFIRSIPAGTRLSVRYQATSNAAAAKPTVAIHGIS